MPAGFGLRGTLGTVSIVVSVVDRATRKVGNIGKSIRQMNVSVSGMSNMLRGIGMAMTVMMTMATAAADSYVKEVIAIEQPLTKLTAVAADSGRTFAEWGALAVQVADEAKISIIDTGKAMYWAASAGITDAEAIKYLTVEAGKMARIHGVDATKAIEILTTTMKTYDVAVEDTTQISNILNAMVGRSLLTFDALGDTLKYAAPLARMVNWEFEGLGAGIMAMANAGIKGSKAGTALRAVITRLAAPVSKARGLMRDLKLEFFTLAEGGQEVKEEMEEAGRAFEKLQTEIEETESTIESLRAVMNRQALEERKLRYEISAIRLRAAAEGRDITNEEMAMIDRLELAIEGMAYEREGLAIIEEEAGLARDKLSKSADEVAEKEEALAEKLKGMRGQMKELPEILEDVAEAFKGLTEQQRIEAAETLVGKRGLAGFIAMLKVADPSLFTTSGLVASGALDMEELAVATGEVAMTLAELRDMLAAEKIAIEESFAARAVAITEESLETKQIEELNKVQEDQLNALIDNKEAMEGVVATVTEVTRVVKNISMMFIKFIGILGKTGGAFLVMLGPILMFAGPIIALVIKGFILLIKYTIVAITKNMGLTASFWTLTTAILASKMATLFLIVAVIAAVAAIAFMIMEVMKMADEVNSSFADMSYEADKMASDIDDSLIGSSIPTSFRKAVDGAVSHLDRLRGEMRDTSREAAEGVKFGVGEAGGTAGGRDINLTIHINTGPITGVAGADDAGKIIGEKVVEAVRRAIP